MYILHVILCINVHAAFLQANLWFFSVGKGSLAPRVCKRNHQGMKLASTNIVTYFILLIVKSLVYSTNKRCLRNSTTSFSLSHCLHTIFKYILHSFLPSLVSILCTLQPTYMSAHALLQPFIFHCTHLLPWWSCLQSSNQNWCFVHLN